MPPAPNASAITAIRTAAVSAVATRVLARADAGDLAIIGAGVQGRSHLMAIPLVRSIGRARIVSRNAGHARALAAEMQPNFEFPLEVVGTVRDAVTDADLIVTATTSLEPVLRREWISPGTHINAVGTYSPRAREIDTATIVAASLFVDRRESALNEAGDYLVDHNGIVYLMDKRGKFVSIFERFDKICFVGHTHVPGVFLEGPDFYSPDELDGKFELADEKAIINVGSVGQPRDRDPRSSFVILTETNVEFVRVAYDVETTIKKVEDIDDLDDFLGTRLRDGR